MNAEPKKVLACCPRWPILAHNQRCPKTILPISWTKAIAYHMKTRQSRLLYLFLTTFCAAADAQVLFQDHFNGSIGPAWTITRPDPSFYTITESGLDLRCSSLDIDVGEDNEAKNLFTIANPSCTKGDFAITMRFKSFVPANNDHAQVCVIAMDDEDNFVRANYGFINGARRAELGKEVAASWSQQQTALDLGDGAFFLRLTKTGRTYTQSYSTNGTNFTKVNSPIRFGNGSPARLGFASGADPSESSHALIDSFTVQMPLAEFQPQRVKKSRSVLTSRLGVGLQYYTKLASTNGWQGMTNVTLGAPTELWFDVQPANQAQRFYRVVPGPITIP